MEGENRNEKMELRALHMGPEVSEVLVAVKMPTPRIMELIGPEVYARMDALRTAVGQLSETGGRPPLAEPEVRKTSTQKSQPTVKPAVRNYVDIPMGRPRCAVKGCKGAKVHGQGQKYCPEHKAKRVRSTPDLKAALSAGGSKDEDA